MQIASILSDLTSLRACEPSAALALVTPHSPDTALSRADTEDPDLKRATDLMELHASVKARFTTEGGGREGLEKARADVRRVERELGV